MSSVIRLDVAKRLDCLEDRPSNISMIRRQINKDDTMSLSFTIKCTEDEARLLSRTITKYMGSILEKSND